MPPGKICLVRKAYNQLRPIDVRPLTSPLAACEQTHFMPSSLSPPLRFPSTAPDPGFASIRSFRPFFGPRPRGRRTVFAGARLPRGRLASIEIMPFHRNPTRSEFGTSAFAPSAMFGSSVCVESLRIRNLVQRCRWTLGCGDQRRRVNPKIPSPWCCISALCWTKEPLRCSPRWARQ
jgi:hypothetical protein